MSLPGTVLLEIDTNDESNPFSIKHAGRAMKPRTRAGDLSGCGADISPVTDESKHEQVRPWPWPAIRQVRTGL